MDFPFAPAPNPTALLEWCAPRVTPDIIETIAQCDYGFEADKCRGWLRRIEAERRIVPHDGSCWEHLELVTNHDASRRMTDSDHLLRAFAASILIADLIARKGRRFFVSISCLGRMTESSLLMGRDASEAASCMMAALIASDTEAAEDSIPLAPYAATALLLLNAHLRSPGELQQQLEAIDAIIDRAIVEAPSLGLVEALGLSADEMVATPRGALLMIRNRLDSGDIPWLFFLNTFDDDHFPWTRCSRIPVDRNGEVCPPLAAIREKLNGPTWRQ